MEFVLQSEGDGRGFKRYGPRSGMEIGIQTFLVNLEGELRLGRIAIAQPLSQVQTNGIFQEGRGDHRGAIDGSDQFVDVGVE